MPRDFCPLPFFYTSQFDRSSLLKIVPFRMHHLEQWAWMHGRWAVAVSDDMSKSSDFCQILTEASDLLAGLDKFAAQLRQHTGFPVPQTFLQDVTDLLLRFTTVRA